MLNKIRVKALVLSTIADIAEGKIKPFYKSSTVEYDRIHVDVFVISNYVVYIEGHSYILQFCRHRPTYYGDREPYRSPSRKIGKLVIDIPKKNGNTITVWY